jgi:hypothetical protein
MKKRFFVLSGMMAATMAFGCFATSEDVELETDSMLQPAAKPNHSPKLVLSHIECTDDGVLAHFVLLFAGKGTPGDLTGTYNGGSFGPIAPEKNSGNVWHYNVIFPAGELEILSASVEALGQTATLHNPGEYAGNYECGPIVEECPILVTPDKICLSQPLGNPGAECGYLGLVPSGKDDNLSGTTFPATIEAYVAIVKSGSGGCEPGESAYAIYVDVQPGDILASPSDQDISHVTYCDCPQS